VGLKRVYLDQRDWIALARIATGRERDPQLREILALVHYSVEQGLASYPLSDSHYFETWKRGDPRSRQDLGRVMYQLSKTHTMSGINELLEPEIARAFAMRYGLPLPPEPRVFGLGLRHLAGDRLTSYFSDPEAESRAIRRHGPEAVEAAFEEGLLVGPGERVPDEGRPSEAWNRKQLEGELDYARRLRKHGHSPDLARRMVLAQEAGVVVQRFGQYARELGWEDEPRFVSPDDLAETVLSLPSKGAVTRMRMTAHANSHFKWELGDLSDVTALAAAASHCDIVVCERKWGDVLQRNQKHLRAKVITNLRQLPELLVV